MAVSYINDAEIADGNINMATAFTSVQAGDIFLYIVAMCTPAGDMNPSGDSTWSLIYDSGFIDGGASDNYNLAVWAHKTPGTTAPSAPSGLFSDTSSTSGFVTHALQFRGADLPTSSSVGTPSTGTAGGVAAISGISVAAGGAIVVLLGNSSVSGTDVAFATLSGDGLTWVETSDIYGPGGGGRDSNLGCDYALCSGATTVTSKTFSLTGAATCYAGVMVKLEEPAPVTPPPNVRVLQAVNRAAFH